MFAHKFARGGVCTKKVSPSCLFSGMLHKEALSLLSISYARRFISLSWHNSFFAEKVCPLSVSFYILYPRGFTPSLSKQFFLRFPAFSQACCKSALNHALSFPEVLDGMFANSLEIDLVLCRIEKMRKTTCNEASP